MKLADNLVQKHLTHPIFSIITEEADRLQMPCYVIGGFVRDIFLYRPSKDIDVVTLGSGIELASAIAKRLGKRAYLSVFKNFGTAQVKYKDIEVEFVGARKESYSHDSRKPIVEDGTLSDDQNRRDFTINALAICLNSQNYAELVDPFGGMHDMEELTIRTPLDPDITFSDDPLRMMRAVRFATQLGFYIEPDTFDAIRRNRERIQIISKERIIDELNKIMSSPKPSVGYKLLSDCELLPIIFPELNALKGVQSIGNRAHKDNFYHSLQVLDNVAAQSNNLWLRWAALLHDIGKPSTKRYDAKLGWTFHNHNFIGEKMLPNIFRKMKLPLNDKMKYVKKLIGLHMRPIVLSEEVVTDSAVRRLLFDAGDDIEDLMTLCEADITSKNEAKVKRFLSNFKLVREKLKEIEEKDRVRNMQPPVSGDDIMQLFALAPCQEVGSIKAMIKDAILDGEIPNEREAALAFMYRVAADMGIFPPSGGETAVTSNPKTAKELMLAGELYDANNDAELLQERDACKELCCDYNQLRPSQKVERAELIGRLLGKCGVGATIEPPFWCDYGYNMEIGDNFYSNHNLVVLDGAKVTIGHHVFIAPNCGIYTATHPIDATQRAQGLETAHPITIGNHVWIGAGTSILSGVTIGDNCVIGAGSVVNRSIPAGSLAVGNPCRVIKEL